MKIQVSTDRTVEGSDDLTQMVETQVQSSLEHFADRLTRVEAHLSDENADKNTPNDKRCLLEARPQGMQPLTTTAHGDTLEQATREAAHKMQSLLKNTFGRIDTRNADATIRQESD